jgi:hypothetical protein
MEEVAPPLGASTDAGEDRGEGAREGRGEAYRFASHHIEAHACESSDAGGWHKGSVGEISGGCEASSG